MLFQSQENKTAGVEDYANIGRETCLLYKIVDKGPFSQSFSLSLSLSLSLFLSL
jgi:hypothetical protein